MNNMLLMDEKKTLYEVRKFFENDKFATENGAVIDEIGDYTATCSLKVTDSHRNAMGAVMGGVYFMLADFAFAVAANWKKIGCVSLHSDISFLGPAKNAIISSPTNLSTSPPLFKIICVSISK